MPGELIIGQLPALAVINGILAIETHKRRAVTGPNTADFTHDATRLQHHLNVEAVLLPVTMPNCRYQRKLLEACFWCS